MAPPGAIFAYTERRYAPPLLCLAQPVKCNTRRAVRHIHDAGTLKPRFNTRALHGQVVPMRIDTQMVGTLFGKGEHRSRDTVHGAVGRHTVQHGVRSVATPLPVLNYVIALVRAR